MARRIVCRDQSEAARNFISCVADGQPGWWATTTRANLSRPPYWFESLDELVDALFGQNRLYMDYFVPYPFLRRFDTKTYDGLAPLVNMVRADVDPDKADPDDKQKAFVAERLQIIRSMLGEPTAVLDSGRGAWVYLKLDRMVPKEEARELNRMLTLLSGSTDQGSHNPSQWVRLPGSENEKTHRIARIERFCPDALFDPVRLRDALEGYLEHHHTMQAKNSLPTSLPGDDALFAFTEEELAGVVLPPSPRFSSDSRRYMELLPETPEESKELFGRVRHEMEQSIFNNLAGNGWSDIQLHAFAYQNKLPRYMEELERGRSRWMTRSIKSARDWVAEHPLVVVDVEVGQAQMMSGSNEKMHPSPSDGLHAGNGEQLWHDLLPGKKMHPHLPWLVLKAVDGGRPGDLHAKFEDRPGGKERNIQRIVAALVRHKMVVRVPGDDGVERLIRTAKGDEQAGRASVPVGLLSGMPTPEERAKKTEKAKRGDERRAKAASAQSRPVIPDDSVGAHAGLPTSASGLWLKRSRHIYRVDMDGHLRLDFNGQKSVFYLQLVTHLDSIVTAKFYSQLHVGWSPWGYPRYAYAISPSDPGVEGDYDDPVLERGRRPRERTLAVAAFLQKAESGFSLAEAVTAEGEIIPAVGLVLEDVVWFWSELLTSVPNADGRILKVKRSGRRDNRRFSFEDCAAAITLPPLKVPNLDQYVDEIGSPERLADLLEPLPDYWSLSYPFK